MNVLSRLGNQARALRIRRRWRQADVAARARVSRGTVSRIERGLADGVTLGQLQRVVDALDARFEPRLLWHGESLDRLLDAGHAAAVERTVRLLADAGWSPRVEVSFSVRGERGSIDVLAFHESTRDLLVVEVKSVVPDVQSMLSALDRKARLGATVGEGLGWPAVRTSRLLVVVESRTSRRRVEAHRATFASVLPSRTVECRRWIRSPGPHPLRGLLFLSVVGQASPRHRVSARHRGAPS